MSVRGVIEIVTDHQHRDPADPTNVPDLVIIDIDVDDGDQHVSIAVDAAAALMIATRITSEVTDLRRCIVSHPDIHDLDRTVE